MSTAHTTTTHTTHTRHAVIVERDVPIPMRDGIILYADIYRPEVGVHPVLLMRTPYNKEDAQTMNYAHPSWYAQHGYVVIVQDVRGRWKSEGEFEPYRHVWIFLCGRGSVACGNCTASALGLYDARDDWIRRLSGRCIPQWGLCPRLQSVVDHVPYTEHG